jgi:tetratricopeptide (TPR) repeat protein
VEFLMRISSIAIAAALTLVAMSSALQGQRGEDPINPRSVELLQQGRAAQAAGNLDRATDLLETALVVDPRNRAAFVALGDVSVARDLPGKAIRLYREALALDANDVSALAGQGRALVKRGAVARAQENLAKIRKLCADKCIESRQLSAVIAAGPPPAQTAQATPPKPMP